MSIEQNVQMIRDLWAKSNDFEPQSMLDFLHEDYIRHASRRDYTRDEFIAVLAERRIAFPDLDARVLDVVAQGDQVAYRWESIGSHQGTYLRIPPTGRPVRAEGITISRFRDGKVIEDWGSWNKNTVLFDLGILPISDNWAEG